MILQCWVCLWNFCWKLLWINWYQHAKSFYFRIPILKWQDKEKSIRLKKNRGAKFLSTALNDSWKCGLFKGALIIFCTQGLNSHNLRIKWNPSYDEHPSLNRDFNLYFLTNQHSNHQTSRRSRSQRKRNVFSHALQLKRGIYYYWYI